MAAPAVALLDQYLQGQSITVGGVSTVTAQMPGSITVTTQDGAQYRLDGVPPAQQAQATSLAGGLDLSPAGQAAQQVAQQRTTAQAQIAAVENTILRAIVLALVDQLNQIGTQHNALLTWLGAETTLANRAALSGFQLPAAITPAQAKAAVQAKASSGAAD